MVSPESVKHKEPEKGGGTMVDLFIVMVDVKLYAFNDVKLLFYTYIYTCMCAFFYHGQPWHPRLISGHEIGRKREETIGNLS